MKITKSQVTKITITQASMREGLGVLDPIAVIVENFGPGEGKITITCFGEAWSAYWSHMGEDNTLESFFLQASKDYLIGKLKTGIQHTIDDEDDVALGLMLKKEILRLRRDGNLGKEQAREYWDEAAFVEWGNRHDICADVLGDEWWYRTPKKSNPDYEYLGHIVCAVKEAFEQLKEKA